MVSSVLINTNGLSSVIRWVEKYLHSKWTGLGHHWCGGELGIALSGAGAVELVFLEGQRHGADVDGFAEVVGSHTNQPVCSALRGKDGVFPAAPSGYWFAENITLGGEGQVLPLAVGGDVFDALEAGAGDPADGRGTLQLLKGEYGRDARH